jgi:hypothetical protein
MAHPVYKPRFTEASSIISVERFLVEKRIVAQLAMKLNLFYTVPKLTAVFKSTSYFTYQEPGEFGRPWP